MCHGVILKITLAQFFSETWCSLLLKIGNLFGVSKQAFHCTALWCCQAKAINILILYKWHMMVSVTCSECIFVFKCQHEGAAWVLIFQLRDIYTVNRKNTPKCFLIYSLQNLTDCDKFCYMLSWVNLSYRNVNVFHLAWIMSLLYLVKLSIHVLQVNKC